MVPSLESHDGRVGQEVGGALQAGKQSPGVLTRHTLAPPVHGTLPEDYRGQISICAD